MTAVPLDDPPSFLEVAYSCSSTELAEDLAAAGFGNIARDRLSGNIDPLGDAEQSASGMLVGNPTADQIHAKGVIDPEALVQSLSSVY